MINFLKRWFKHQLSYFFWTYIPLITTVIFGVFMVSFFPDIAIQSIAAFFLLMLVFVFLFSR
ncbi:hypothetical protein EJP81_21310 [Rahnella aquatilis]|jgi:hypothetical protein|nr:hypothetical protein EJP79_21310 [Rahnella aquatilis]AZP48576.1 hypothetical protein EJP81_21310 [Rahnella aquatilis]RKT64251.1 hypothetical protein BJ925_5096 [Rahnella aquatilis]